MRCEGCGRDAEVVLLGPWCDECGGVASRPHTLLYRHVATVDGKGGRYPICFDHSTSDYVAAHERLVPSPFKKDMDGFRPHHIARVIHGTLDAVIAYMQPVARGPVGNELPDLLAAPRATTEELAILAL